MSHTVVDAIARMKVRYPDRVHFLLGNHELAEVTDYPIQKNRQMLNVLFRMGLEQMYGPESERVREALLGFLLVVSAGGANRAAACSSVTASPRKLISAPSTRRSSPGRFDPLEFYERGDIFRLVCGRDHREENARTFAELMNAQVLIHGHEPCQEGFALPNPYQVILDCCGERALYALLSPDRQWTQAVCCFGRSGDGGKDLVSAITSAL